VSCLPRDLPEYFEVDISGLQLDEMLHLSDIKVPEGVEIIELTHGEGHDHAIVSIHVHKAAPLEEEAPAAEVPVEGEQPEGEAPAEDAGKAESD
ncbi:MAG: 50S ribosomal protein L25/general stress protein Ctc, partial [Planctomycetaceae bacterium]